MAQPAAERGTPKAGLRRDRGEPPLAANVVIILIDDRGFRVLPATRFPRNLSPMPALSGKKSVSCRKKNQIGIIVPAIPSGQIGGGAYAQS